jgi:hypothetical protein
MSKPSREEGKPLNRKKNSFLFAVFLLRMSYVFKRAVASALWRENY